MTDRISLDRFLYVMIALCLFVGLGSYALENINEGLYAEIPREMLRLNEYIIPHLNYVPYLEKPPLLYWLIAASYKLFGISEMSARLVPAVAASATVLTVLLFMRKIKLASEGALASLMLLCSVIVILLSRIVLFDMLLTAFLTGALCSFYLWYDQKAVKYLQWSYGLVGLAVMSKGLIALVVSPMVALLFLWRVNASAQTFKRFFNLPGILLFLLITAPWHLLAALSLPDFAYQYFINEHWLRFLDLRIPHDYHTGPWYFYLPRLVIYSLPWSVFAVFLFRKSTQAKPLLTFCWIWLMVPLVFYSLSKAKGDYYMVLGMAPLMILLAMKLTEFIPESDYLRAYRYFLAVCVTLIAFVGLLCAATVSPMLSQWLPTKLHLEPFIVQPALLALVGWGLLMLSSVFALRMAWFKLPVVYALFALLMLPAVWFLIVDKAHFESKHSEKGIAQAILRLNDTLPVYLYKDYEDLSSINFYLQRRVGMIDSRSSDLYFGSHTQQAQTWFVDLNSIRASKASMFIIMKPKNAVVFQPQFCIVHREGSSVLMTNDAQLCAERVSE